MRPCNLMNPTSEEQEAENAAYIARECERIQANRTGGGDARDLPGTVEPRDAAHYLRVRSRALRALQERLKATQLEKEAIERALESEKGTMNRQRLLKELWNLCGREEDELDALSTAPADEKRTVAANQTTERNRKFKISDQTF